MNKLEKTVVWWKYQDNAKMWFDYYVTITDEKERAMVRRFIKETIDDARNYAIENDLMPVD